MQNNDKVVSTIKVYETTDYDKFTPIKGNRKLDKGHIRGLQKSIIDNGNRTADDPIEVSEDFKTLDGQHRLAALEALGYPVYYRIKELGTVKDIRIANSNRANWSWYDYATSYRDEQSNKDYAEFLELANDFTKLSKNFNVIIAYSGFGSGKRNKITRSFLDGDFKMKDFERSRELVGTYEELAETAKINNRQFSMACLKFIQTSTYNHQHMLGKLKTHKSALANCYIESDYLFTLQDIWRA